MVFTFIYVLLFVSVRQRFNKEKLLKDETLLRVARRKDSFKRMDIFGNDWYAETTKDHKQIWVKVHDGGINNRPVPVMKDGMHKASWYPKNGVKLP
ncbi:Serine transporter [Lactiplantibacillus plantarum]|nr:Serine transporter [Lactiplantibacillus plantarum]KZU27294.1 Serine transporter [Lactiplantibacillus plantarum]